MSGYKRYPAYKESGVEWIGEIPAAWSKKQLKFVSKIVNGATPKSGVTKYWDGDRVWITPVDLGACEGKKISDSERKLTDIGINSCGTEISPAGSIVLSSRAPIGYIALTAVESCINQGCKTVIPAESVDKDYLYYLLKSAIEELRSCGQGSTFMELPTHRLKDLVALVPPDIEQTKIAAFLDRKTAQIDHLIEIKRRQIEVLKEERTAVINHAVTKGLNPSVKMKESGIEWIGEIPEGWMLTPLKRFADVKYGLGQPPKLCDDGLPLIRATNVERGKINTRGLIFVDPCDVPYERDPILRTNDIVVVRSGAYTGDSAIITKEYDGSVAGYDMVVRIKKGSPKFSHMLC